MLQVCRKESHAQISIISEFLFSIFRHAMRPPLGMQLVSNDEPKLFRRGDFNEFPVIAPHTHPPTATDVTTLITPSGFCTLLPAEVASHPQHLTLIELDRQVITLTSRELGQWLLRHQAVLEPPPRLGARYNVHDFVHDESDDGRGSDDIKSSDDGTHRGDASDVSCATKQWDGTQSAEARDLATVRVTLATTDLHMAELKAFVVCAEHVCGVQPPLRRLQLLRHGQKAMRCIRWLGAESVLRAIQESVRRYPDETITELVNQKIFRTAPSYRVHVLESREHSSEASPS